MQTGYPNVDPRSDAAGKPPREHKPQVEAFACENNPHKPALHTDGMEPGAWIRTDDLRPNLP